MLLLLLLCCCCCRWCARCCYCCFAALLLQCRCLLFFRVGVWLRLRVCGCRLFDVVAVVAVVAAAAGVAVVAVAGAMWPSSLFFLRMNIFCLMG